MKNVIEEVRKFVEEECKKPENKYGLDAFNNHFVSVVKYARELAAKKNADLEIVEIAAWLHDIGSIIYGRENHHITGCEIAERKLRELGLEEEKIEKIKKGILNHRGSINNKRESKEEQIIADADAMSHFDDFAGLFKAAYLNEGFIDSRKANDSVKNHLVRDYNKLSEEAKKIIKNKYEAAMLLLK